MERERREWKGNERNGKQRKGEEWKGRKSGGKKGKEGRNERKVRKKIK